MPYPAWLGHYPVWRAPYPVWFRRYPAWCSDPLSRRQFPDHRQDAIRHQLQFRIDHRQRPRRLEHIEMPVERDFIADLRLLLVDPGIRRVRQYLTRDIGRHSFPERHVLGIAQRRIGLRPALLLA